MLHCCYCQKPSACCEDYHTLLNCTQKADEIFTKYIKDICPDMTENVDLDIKLQNIRTKQN